MYADATRSRLRDIEAAALEEYLAAMTLIAEDLDEDRTPSPEQVDRAETAKTRLENARALLALTGGLGYSALQSLADDALR